MRISEAESQVMEVLWSSAPRSAEEVYAALAGTRDWQEATVKTLLNRLLKKRAVAATREGRRYLYRPLIERTDYVHAESKSLLDRLFDGRVAPLVAHFSERTKLSKKDIAEIRALIEDLERDR
jgi:predicted transcriptional regulator